MALVVRPHQLRSEQDNHVPQPVVGGQSTDGFSLLSLCNVRAAGLILAWKSVDGPVMWGRGGGRGGGRIDAR